MTENKNFCVSSLYDLLKNDNINIRWEGSNIHLKRPGGLSDLHKIAFRNFKGELQPFTNIELPKLKADVLIMSNGLKEINLTSDDDYDLPGNIKYENTKINKIMTVDKAWTYNENSENGVIYDNIKELFDIITESLHEYFTTQSITNTIDLTDLTTWAPLKLFYGINRKLNSAYSPLITDTATNIYYYDSSTTSIKTFTMTWDYIKAYPGFYNNKDLIITFINHENDYEMKIYYGSAPNYTLLHHIQHLPYSSNVYAFDGAGPGGGKYYNTYTIINPFGLLDANKFPLVFLSVVNASANIFTFYFFNIQKEDQLSEYYTPYNFTTSNLNNMPLIKTLKTAGELKEMWILSASVNTTSATNNVLFLLKVEHENNIFYMIQNGNLNVSYGVYSGGVIYPEFSIVLPDTSAYFSDYDPTSYQLFNNFGTNGAFNGYVNNTIAYYSEAVSETEYNIKINLCGGGFYEIYTKHVNECRYVKEPFYTSNIVSGYYDDGHIHGLIYLEKTTGGHFYKAVSNTDFGSSPLVSSEVSGQYYDIDKHYGQFLNGGPILFYDNENLSPTGNPNAVRIYSVIASDVSCTALDNSNNSVSLNPSYGGKISYEYGFKPFALNTLSNDGSALFGSAYIPEIFFASDYGANILLKIYTDPYYFSLITSKIYTTNLTEYNMTNTLTDLIYRASNDNILKMIEYLILLRYNNNNVIMRCSNFPNNDGVIFNINEESKINFKTMITDNTQQEIIISLEGNDGTPITYELLKEIYAHVCVSIDWIQ